VLKCASNFDRFLTLPADIFAEIFDTEKVNIYHPTKGGDDDDDPYDMGQAFDDLNENWAACNIKLVKKLTAEFYNKVSRASDLRLNNYGNRRKLYSGLRMKCGNKEQPLGGDAYYLCSAKLYDNSGNEVDIQDDDDDSNDCEDNKIFRNDCPYRDGGNSCGSDPVKFHAIPLPWTAGGDFDNMATLAFGGDPNDSGALVCRLAEIAESDLSLAEEDVMPGFCCVDRPFDVGRSSDLWGFPVNMCMC
jgi:hypothetical protein